jgi:hypothetical protein
VRQFSARLAGSRRSLIPSARDRSWVQPFSVCLPSQSDAGPWQDSQLTPSVRSKVRARCASGTASAWQARHRGSVSGCFSPANRAMRLAASPDRTANARECLSFTTQLEYSFCSTEVSSRTCTEPWQLGEAHEPGPVYPGPSAACASASAEQTTNRTHARITVYRVPERRRARQSACCLSSAVRSETRILSGYFG